VVHWIDPRQPEHLCMEEVFRLFVETQFQPKCNPWAADWEEGIVLTGPAGPG
jgi:hypothetical protein